MKKLIALFLLGTSLAFSQVIPGASSLSATGGAGAFSSGSFTGTTAATSPTTGTLLVGNGTAATNVGIGGGVGWFGSGVVIGTTPDALHGLFTIQAGGSSDQLTGYSSSTFIFGLGRDTNGVLLDSLDTVTLMTGSASGARSGVRAFSLSTAGNATFLTKITSYNGAATAGNGVSVVVAAPRQTAVTNTTATLATYTVPAADTTYRVSANVQVTATTAAAMTVVCTYTDETNTSRAQTIPFTQLAGTFLTSITNATGTGPYEGATLEIRCKASTTIVFTTVGTVTGITYNVQGTVTQEN